jgi:hypothetical protein
MTLEQLEQAKKYEKAMLKARSIKETISSVVYNVEKANGINIAVRALNQNVDDNKYNQAKDGGLFFEEVFNLAEENSTDIDLMRHFMGAAERATEYFKKKIEEI